LENQNINKCLKRLKWKSLWRFSSPVRALQVIATEVRVAKATVFTAVVKKYSDRGARGTMVTNGFSFSFYLSFFYFVRKKQNKS